MAHSGAALTAASSVASIFSICLVEVLKMAVDIRQQGFRHDGEAILLHRGHRDQLPAPHQQ
ncbi:hypothetical protein QQ73_15510, partial [Candidatus Endoriftia persephone str. Guaymas]|nr:hypothetical protein [Candidatus Endoriftia persephone str. Guaymas]